MPAPRIPAQLPEELLGQGLEDLLTGQAFQERVRGWASRAKRQPKKHGQNDHQDEAPHPLDGAPRDLAGGGAVHGESYLDFLADPKLVVVAVRNLELPLLAG